MSRWKFVARTAGEMLTELNAIAPGEGGTQSDDARIIGQFFKAEKNGGMAGRYRSDVRLDS